MMHGILLVEHGGISLKLLGTLAKHFGICATKKLIS
jgi:hypothetical protein